MATLPSKKLYYLTNNQDLKDVLQIAQLGDMAYRKDTSELYSFYGVVGGNNVGYKVIAQMLNPTPTLQMAYQAPSTAPDLPTLVNDFNALLNKLRNAGYMALS